MSQTTIEATDRTGSFSAYIALPDGGRGPGMIVIQEIFGINPFVREICDHYASLGYIAVAPDLFWRMEPGLDLDSSREEDMKKAFDLFGRFNVAKSVDDLVATLSWLRQNEACTGKVGAIGYCLGGKLAYLMATRSEVDAAVGYYGVGIQDLLEEASAITHPLTLHVAEEDKYVPPEAQEQIVSTLGGIAHVSVHRYPGVDHAFARTGGDHYDANAAALANQRTETFFAEALR